MKAISRKLIIILLSFSLGIVVSQHFLKKNDVSLAQNGEQSAKEQDEVELSQKSQQLAGVALEEVKLGQLTKRLAVVGQITQDPTASSYVTSSVSGIIEECKTKIGTRVNKDETISVIKSGDALAYVKSPISGIIVSDLCKVGEKIDTVSSLCTVADLSKLWATFDVYEKDVAPIKLGQKINVHSIAYPEESFSGEITFISPVVDDSTRTVKVRALIQNPDYRLKLGMFLSGEILETFEQSALLIPEKAVVFIENKPAVFVPGKDGKYSVRYIKTGHTGDNFTEVDEGLKEGESVVADGSFQLKSEFLKSTLEED